MIADEIEKLIAQKHHEARRLGIFDELKLSVYVDVDTWREMMSELRGKLSLSAYSLYQSMGMEIMGAKIHKVIPRDGEAPHGIKVFNESVYDLLIKKQFVKTANPIHAEQGEKTVNA